jgi:choline-sulfatase
MPRPNVLLLLSDEHSFRCLGHRAESAGGEPVQTPNLDRLAGLGTRFDSAYCQMPLCTPSRICMLTGLEVARCGAWNNGSILPPELPTLASTFTRAGYQTGLLGKMHLGGNRQFAGFAHRPYGDLTGRTGHQWEPVLPSGAGTDMAGRTRLAGVTQIPESQHQEQIVAGQTLAFLREHTAARPEQPWLLCASFSRPHFPLTAPKRWMDRYKDRAGEPQVPAAGDAWDHPMSVGMREGFQADRIDHDERTRAREAYFACVSYLDQILGDLLARLDAAGLLDNTIIVYTTDHGELAGEHGVWWKSAWYEACTRVPWIVSTPQQRAGSDTARAWDIPVSLADLFPTLCGLADVDAPEKLTGVDLSASVCGDSPPPDRPVFIDHLIPRWGPGTEFRAVRQGRYKYVRFRDCPPLAFDVCDDPGEQRNLLARPADQQPEHLAELARIAETSVDFEQAEADRLAGQQDLASRFPPLEGPKPGNFYQMSDGRIIDADRAVYRPEVLTDSPGHTFADWPGRCPER